MARLCQSWNAALDMLHSQVTADEPVPLRHYGNVLRPDDVAPIPERDLPPGLPEWMRDLRAWAKRTGATPVANAPPSLSRSRAGPATDCGTCLAAGQPPS